MTRAILAGLALVFRTSIAVAQLGELQLGVIGGYGEPESHGAGGGFTLAVVPGRVSYLGLRYFYSTGGTTSIPGNVPTQDVRTRSQLIAADLGLQVPVGSFELVIGSSFGATAFRQEQNPQVVTAWEFTVAPTATLFIRAGRLLLAPEFQWIFAGSPGFNDSSNPEFKVKVAHSGAQLNLRIVLPFEIDRIRQ